MFHGSASEFEYTMLLNGRYQFVLESLDRGEIHVKTNVQMSKLWTPSPGHSHESCSKRFVQVLWYQGCHGNSDSILYLKTPRRVWEHC